MRIETKINLGEVTMMELESGVVISFMAGDPTTLRGISSGNASAKEYVSITQEMTAQAYDDGLLEGGSDKTKVCLQLARQAARRALGARFREARTAKGLSVRAVAEMTGIAHHQICRTEAGRINPTIDTLSALAAALDVTITIE